MFNRSKLRNLHNKPILEVTEEDEVVNQIAGNNDLHDWDRETLFLYDKEGRLVEQLKPIIE